MDIPFPLCPRLSWRRRREWRRPQESVDGGWAVALCGVSQRISLESELLLGDWVGLFHNSPEEGKRKSPTQNLIEKFRRIHSGPLSSKRGSFRRKRGYSSKGEVKGAFSSKGGGIKGLAPFRPSPPSCEFCRSAAKSDIFPIIPYPTTSPALSEQIVRSIQLPVPPRSMLQGGPSTTLHPEKETHHAGWE